MTVGDALDSLCAECARLRAENAELRNKLDGARAGRDTAQALCHYQRNGGAA
jgi:hypothetical protein